MSFFYHEKKWVASWQGHTIVVTNWWDLLLRTGESLIIDGRPIPQSRPPGMAASNLYGEINISGNVPNVRVHIGHTWGLKIACHIFVGDQLVGGDIDKKFLV
ncbi:MAG: hypothetical protein HYR76_01605 [Ignavibacteria bacterium]|nr:hypothetical protein [Ignavibacteria bacterium]MBI3765282.1 hypothetical protein [Ignavibacteriales bacterium]